MAYLHHSHAVQSKQQNNKRTATINIPQTCPSSEGSEANPTKEILSILTTGFSNVTLQEDR